MTFLGNLLLPLWGASATAIVQPVCFASFAAAILWTFWRRPAKAAVELLWATAVVSIAVGLLDAVIHGDRLARTLGEGQFAVLGVDLVAVAMGIGFAWLGFATRKRAVEGDPCSVWSSRRTTTHTAPRELQEA